MLEHISGLQGILTTIAESITTATLGAAAGMPGSTADVIDKTAKTLHIAAWAVGVAVGVLAIIFFALKIRNELSKGKPAAAPDPASAAIDTALASERNGDFVKAAMNYENLGDNARAAAMYEKGKEYAKAAKLYEKLGKFERAVAMYKRAGESLKAAGVFMRTKNYAEAAKIFKNKGDTLRAAQAFEMMGNKMAAAREYAASGQYMRAARMYKDERMFREAGEVYAKEIGDAPITALNMGKYYTYAAFLVMAEDLEAAEKVYKSIAEVDATFRDVQEKIRLIGLRTGEQQEPVLAIDRVTAGEGEKQQPVAAAVKEVTRPVAPSAKTPPPAREVVAKQEPASVDSYEDAIESLFAPKDSPRVLPAAPAPPETPPPAPPEAPPEAPPKAAPAVPPVAPAEEQVDLTVPSFRVQSAPSRDASVSDIAHKVMGQGDIDELFEEEGGDFEEQVSEEDALRREATLRSILKSGRMDPRYSMRMWMQILKKLYEKHASGVYYGSIPPESIHIDMENNVRLDDPGRQDDKYTAPEVLSGAQADEQTDIYAMGAILYEMVTGTVETIGEIYPIDAYDDIPEWMDEMIMRCLEKDRSARYSGLDDISSLVLHRAAND